MPTPELPSCIFAAGEEPSGYRVNSYHKVKVTQSILDALSEDEILFLRNSSFGKSVSVAMVVEMLKNKKVKDRETRLKFACLAIVSSILLPSSHKPKIHPEHVEMIRDLNEFMAYPWGRLSFQELMSSLLKKDELALSKDSFALRGYVEAIQMVLMAAVPELKEEVTPNAPVVVQDSDSEEADMELHAETEATDKTASANPPENTKYALVPAHAKAIDLECKIRGRSILDSPHEVWDLEADVECPDELEDALVDTVVDLVSSCFRFKKKMFKGGATVLELSRIRNKKRKGKMPKDNNESDDSSDSSGEDTTDQDSGNDLANMVSIKLKEEISRIVEKVSKGVEHQERMAGMVAEKIDGIQAVVIDTVLSRLRKELPGNDLDFNPAQEAQTSKEPASTTMPTSSSAEQDPKDPEQPTVDPSGAIRKVLSDLHESQVDDGTKQVAEPNHEVVDPLSEIPTETTVPAYSAHTVFEQGPSIPLPEGNKPSFSLGVGVSQPQPTTEVVSATPIGFVLPQVKVPQPTKPSRQSKRARVTPAGLEDFKCDATVLGGLVFMKDLERHYMDVLEQVTWVKSIKISSDREVSAFDFVDIALRSTQMASTVMDSLMEYIRSQTPTSENIVLVSCTKLPATLMSHHSRFLKTALKDRTRFKFSGQSLSCISSGFKGRLYFPFNIDQQHWIGVCVDFKSGVLHVLDCNTALMTDSLMRKELNPLATMLPFIAMDGSKADTGVTPKALSVTRCKGIPQASATTDAAVMTVLLIEAHKDGGVDACKTITPRVLPGAAKQ
ncbi:hypothetical protein Rs2_16223 [Raphanus sativus]|nr:hypothetical protein Rs2_16223 [Raphanus sativus]